MKWSSNMQIFFNRRGVLDATLCGKACLLLAECRWYYPGTPVSSTNKTDRHDIIELLLKMTLNTIERYRNWPCMSYKWNEVQTCKYFSICNIFLTLIFRQLLVAVQIIIVDNMKYVFRKTVVTTYVYLVFPTSTRIFTYKSEIFRHKTSHMVLSIIFLEDKHKIVLHLSIFDEYQQFFQHRICFSQGS
jgi:hypothetical protein